MSKDKHRPREYYDRRWPVESPPVVILDDERSKSTTPHSNDPVKHTPPHPEMQSMGVYTPDSTTNSVHSLHGYSQCDLDVNQLGIGSPSSISSSDMAPPSVGEPPRPPSYSDCVHHHSPASLLPQYPPHHASIPPPKPQSTSRKSQNTTSHHRNRTTPPSQHQLSRQPYPQGNYMNMQGNYMNIPQGGSYVSVPMSSVIQHRMASQQSASHQSCSTVGSPTNFYLQSAMHQQSSSGQGNSPSCSLSKLQQLTNGFDMIAQGHCSTMTPPPMNLTPPPSSHSTMTPPPHQAANYQRLYPSNSSSRSSHQVPARSPNVSINPQLMAQYPSFNGYRQQAGYSGFINQSAQLPVQMSVMNQYTQDQQNTMYTAYGLYNSSSLMQPLNSTIRR